METFTKLEVWKKAHQFVLETYKLTSSFPKEETFGLTSQFRRAAVSIAANIAEGYPKHSKKDKIRFYEIALSSASECSYFLILTKDLQYGEVKKLNILLSEVQKMLIAYTKKIKESI